MRRKLFNSAFGENDGYMSKAEYKIYVHSNSRANEKTQPHLVTNHLKESIEMQRGPTMSGISYNI